MAEAPVEQFHANTGRGMGYLGLVVGAVVFLGGLMARDLPVAIAGLLLALLVWMAMLRPAVGRVGELLVLRSMVETVDIPLAAVQSAVVRQFLVVRVGPHRFICPAIGQSRRQIMRADQAKGAPPDPLEVYPVFVEQRIVQLADDARAELGIEERSEEEYELAGRVRRHPAWPEIAGLVVLVLAFVASVVL